MFLLRKIDFLIFKSAPIGAWEAKHEMTDQPTARTTDRQGQKKVLLPLKKPFESVT